MQGNQLLFGPLVIDTGLGKEDDSLSPATAIGRGLEPFDGRTDLRIRLGGPVAVYFW
ncbi:hypothetical protein A2U01_0014438 [Trifolium medium]|uniref:Uncharacterized protein n=1 Tax=Trifolium medium TaxID=97028 RepID=A0A392N113_9FABA|nr:hypothetical protein [Trifolium medium]